MSKGLQSARQNHSGAHAIRLRDLLQLYLNRYNSDHTITGQIANDVAIMTTVPNNVTDSLPLPKIPIVYFIESVAGLDFQPEEYVDITDTFDVKQAMLAKHESQVGDWLQDQ
ncbi:PIG-L deacetylase family protein [Paenibacillus luteus]|uniref:PIG-L deacetylase family protein n=1 Tax=Paenibacillus luteus TaxID=2545753 RepID=UPI001142F8F7|nr:hypothetical protein [Paenibacillus luteus]